MFEGAIAGMLCRLVRRYCVASTRLQGELTTRGAVSGQA